MHLLKDENGNPIPHGEHYGHTHEHSHDHDHEHSHENHHSEEMSQDKAVSLLHYMYHHNEQHADELEQMLQKIEGTISAAAAESIKGAVADFRQGNEKLGLALKLMQK